MSTHIKAGQGDIADKVLLPGDPLRAKWIAENFLKDAICYNKVRNMLGYTGYYKGHKLSVQGTGMGMPSASIYIEELINDFKVKHLIRVGSAGSLQEQVKLRDVVIAMSSSTNSALNHQKFKGDTFAPTADFQLFQKAVNIAQSNSVIFHAGNVFSSDTFYADNEDYYKVWAQHQVLCVEMEMAALYSIAARHKAKALGILTISDLLISGESTTAIEREQSFGDMVRIALETLID